MTEVVLRHEDPTVLPILGSVAPNGSVTPNLSDSGWSIDLDTDPVDAREEIARRTYEAEQKASEKRPEPHFAAVNTEPAGDPAGLAQIQPASEPVEQPEQGEDTSLDFPKE